MRSWSVAGALVLGTLAGGCLSEEVALCPDPGCERLNACIDGHEPGMSRLMVARFEIWRVESFDENAPVSVCEQCGTRATCSIAVQRCVAVGPTDTADDVAARIGVTDLLERGDFCAALWIGDAVPPDFVEGDCETLPRSAFAGARGWCATGARIRLDVGSDRAMLDRGGCMAEIVDPDRCMYCERVTGRRCAAEGLECRFAGGAAGETSRETRCVCVPGVRRWDCQDA